jgi:1-acyl-sn-glycerol-3-phosphate acyltransferase
VIRGTRHAFPPKKGWPNPGPIEIEFLEPIIADATAPDAAAVELRERARSAILDELKEPDLVAVA